jgi:hypothetical protein
MTLRNSESRNFFSTNGTFWVWSFHAALLGRISAKWNDRLFPSDLPKAYANRDNLQTRVKIMLGFKLDKNYLYALLLAFMASAVLPACSSSEEAAQPEDDVQSEVCDEMGANSSGGCM